jgi:UPF0716 protein FxsA
LGRLLFLVFLIVPMIEIAFFVLIGQAIGLWPTLAGVLITAVVGSLVLRHQGLSLVNEIRSTMSRGQLPARAMLDAMLVAVAGLMLLLPGYFSDLIGIVLLIPPVRNLLYAFLKSRFVLVSTNGPGAGFSRPAPERRGTIELDDDEWRHKP